MKRCCRRVIFGAVRSPRMSSTAAVSRSLEGKVAIVTASTEGIGFGIARQLARDGAKVMISSRKKDKVNKAVSQLEKEEQGCTVRGVVCHVAKPEHRKNLIQQTLHDFGGIDILVSNAAANPTFGPVLQTPEEAWDKIFDVNVKSAFLLAKDIIPLMEKRGGGSVIFISSIGGFRPMQVERDLNEVSRKLDKLRREREACHEKLSDIKNMVSFIMQAVAFWDEIVMVTETTTVETENLQRIVNLAGKKTDPVRILKSSGTGTMMASFKDRWMEVAEMISSDRNNVIFDEVVLTKLMLKLTGFSCHP